jgi:hypothetical protein
VPQLLQQLRMQQMQILAQALHCGGGFLVISVI